MYVCRCVRVYVCMYVRMRACVRACARVSTRAGICLHYACVYVCMVSVWVSGFLRCRVRSDCGCERTAQRMPDIVLLDQYSTLYQESSDIWL